MSVDETKTTASVNSVFANFQKHLDEEQELKEEIRVVVRDLEQTARELLTHLQQVHQESGIKNGKYWQIEQTARELLTHLQQVHQESGIKNVSAVCDKARPFFEAVKCKYGLLAQKIPQNQYYRFHDHWKFVTQRLAFLCSFIKYLETEQMIGREEVAIMIGVKSKKEEGFHIDLEDYLLGLLQLASELSRLAVNSVTAGDYSRPLRIAKFVGELNGGFRLLNLKNDALRKRFDGLKYDLKKVEEIVYDLTIRGLKPTTTDETMST